MLTTSCRRLPQHGYMQLTKQTSMYAKFEWRGASSEPNKISAWPGPTHTGIQTILDCMQRAWPDRAWLLDASLASLVQASKHARSVGVLYTTTSLHLQQINCVHSTTIFYVFATEHGHPQPQSTATDHSHRPDHRAQLAEDPNSSSV